MNFSLFLEENRAENLRECIRFIFRLRRRFSFLFQIEILQNIHLRGLDTWYDIKGEFCTYKRLHGGKLR